jgi:hypothetical protein
MYFVQAGGHPEALSLNSLYETPIHGCRAGTQGLVHTVTESYALDERQAVGEF